MDYAKLWHDPEYDREVPCVNCKEPAKLTVAGNNMKCWSCGHIFKEDGLKIEVECFCKKCAPQHDPLAGKKKGKKAELVMDGVNETEEGVWGDTCLDHPDSDRFCDPDCRRVSVDRNGKPIKQKSSRAKPRRTRRPDRPSK